MSNNAVMTKKKTAADNGKDRHKKNKMARIRIPLAKELEALAQERSTDFTEEANRAVRELLEREGRWPSKKPDDPCDQHSSTQGAP
jgi:hypothetical protein